MQWFQVPKTGPWIGPIFMTMAVKKRLGWFALLLSCPALLLGCVARSCIAIPVSVHKPQLQCTLSPADIMEGFRLKEQNLDRHQ